MNTKDYVKKDFVLPLLDWLYVEVWGCDIPSPTVPEYIEHHRDIQYILKCIEKLKEDIRSNTGK